ncbi:unnamed protein product, partial [Mesorhabditis spiculigera]
MLVTLSESSCIMRFETAVDESLSGHLQFLIDPLEQKLGLDRGISNAPRPLKNLDPKRADGTWLSNLQLNWTVMDHPNQVLYVLNNKNFVGVYAFNATHNLDNKEDWRNIFGRKADEKQLKRGNYIEDPYSDMEASIDPTALLLWLLFIVMVILTILVFALYRLSVHNARKYLDEQDKAHFLEQQAGTGAPCYNNRTTLDQSVDNWPAY